MQLPEMSLCGGLLILAAALLRSFGNRLPVGTYLALWGIAVLRLLVPFTLESGVSVYNAVTLAAPAKTQPVQVVFSPSGGQPIPFAAPVEEAVDPLLLIWLCGVVLCGGMLLVGWLRCRWMLRDAVPCEFLDESALTAGGSRRIRIRQSDRIRSPLTYGILRPVILLPSSMPRDPQGIRLVLAHECVHIRRFHPLAKLLLLLTATIHWFNPAVWYMVSRAGRDLERRCDETVLRETGCPGDYARMLLSLESERSGLLPVSGFAQHPLKERLQNIMQRRTYTRPIVLLSILLVLALSAVLVTSALSVPDTTLAPEAGTSEPPLEPEENAPENSAASLPEADIPLEEPSIEESTPEVDAQVQAVLQLYAPLDGDWSVAVAYSDRHAAMDLRAAHGAPIFAAGNGVVSQAGYDVTLGNYLVIDHVGGWQTFYAHCDTLQAAAGDVVEAGAPVATVGSTGASTGPHLHFALWQNGSAVDPAGYMVDIG